MCQPERFTVKYYIHYKTLYKCPIYFTVHPTGISTISVLPLLSHLVQ